MSELDVLDGYPSESGAKVLPDGINFCVFSRNATKVILCLFDSESDKVPYREIVLDEHRNRTGDLWHVFVKGLKANALYLYRVDGPDDIKNGQRFNAAYYLFDPKAKAFSNGSVFANTTSLQRCPVNKMPKCVAVSDEFNWEGDRPLHRPLNETVIYEAHLKGFTASSTSGVDNPGTYAGFAEKIPYLKNLGINAVELLPVFEFDENENLNTNPRNGERLKNYWGYSTIGFFAPKVGFASSKCPGDVVREFKGLVRDLHKAGIEVILDVVFNHTAEGNEHGVTLNFRGFDNTVYYHLVDSQKEYYMNFSGCGNSLNCNHPVVQDFIIDCLRYWVSEMHVDGFRFDLAGVFCRDRRGFICGNPALTERISEDPVLSKTKIIAEPWDAAGGYFVGNFPGGRWCEWNDKYRDGLRSFIRGDDCTTTEAATRIAGSSDIYSPSGRMPVHSINFVACHDGFTLNDLVSYNGKHNEQNGEQNRDGSDNNISYNYGWEGPCDNRKIEDLRLRQIKNLLTCLFVSQGVPMLLSGDEVRHTQYGNNNVYCQDNSIAWFNWEDVNRNGDLLDFTRKLIAIRRNHRVLQRRTFYGGQSTAGDVTPADISWFSWAGCLPDWNTMKHFLAFRLGGGVGLKDVEEDNDFYVAINTDIHDLTVVLPSPSIGRSWFRLIDTSITDQTSALWEGMEDVLSSQDRYVVPANSVVVLIAK